MCFIDDPLTFRNVNNVIVYPGHITTEMFKGFGMRCEAVFRKVSVDEVADAILSATEHEIFIPAYTRFGWVFRMLPPSVTDGIRRIMNIRTG